jgi:hypothetical protein
VKLVLEVKERLGREHPSLPGRNGRDGEDMIIWFLKDHKFFVDEVVTKLSKAIESASRPLVDFSVLNDNLITGLISCGKCIRIFLMKVQIYSLIHLLKYNYETNGTM